MKLLQKKLYSPPDISGLPSTHPNNKCIGKL